ncbi:MULTISPECIES: HD domain-containing protein [Caloramator]|uniref:HD domain-containing protein n=1 Tax=Caloramator proteoclasticus DSM 10124 TaxID=1121262 RepID=A0A1M5A5F3_9CLOT|nr:MULTISPECIES: HD domain-containing protein [Caloramator]SHF25501.1 HD domain-containing protein [Caloramator proteoclasticus DSM 10124]
MNSLALKIAWDVHKEQKRKGSNAPYIIHPVEVAVIILENGGDDDLVTAGLLHDTLEDITSGRMELLKLIKTNFPKRVVDIVLSVTEQEKLLVNRSLTRSEKINTWKKRKQEAIDKLKNASIDVKIVSCADKLSNIRSMVEDYNTMRDKLWVMFNAGYDEQKWYYFELLDVFLDLKAYPMYKELQEKINYIFK